MKNWGYLMTKNNDIWGILGENRGLKDKILILGAKMTLYVEILDYSKMAIRSVKKLYFTI
jgi:hypothetical protein